MKKQSRFFFKLKISEVEEEEEEEEQKVLEMGEKRIFKRSRD